MILQSRSDFVGALFEYLDPLLAHYSEGGARLFLAGGGAQYEDEVIPMEAWARPLWGLVPFWAGGGRSVGGAFERLYERGLAAGTNPENSEYWGGCRDHDQRFVEMAAIAYGLLLAPEVLWEPLSSIERDNVAKWLYQVNEHGFPAGNWLWFRVLVNSALRGLDLSYDVGLLEQDLDELDSFYIGNGWYQDGPTGLPDYYNAMTFQYFCLLYARLFRESDRERSERYAERCRLFAVDYLRLFATRGEGVPYGRSMTYRFAQAGFWSMAAATGVDPGEPFSPEVIKGLVSRNIQSWDHGRVCDNGGVLSIGYHYPNLHMAEGYNAAGSPMWCLMAFACLALPESDSFWRVSCRPLPARAGIEAALGKTGLVARCDDGEVVLYPSGRVPGHPFAQSDAKYSKFAYSSRFGFSVARSSRSIEETAPDSMLAFVVGGRVYVRDGVESSEVASVGGETGVVSRWRPCPGISVETAIVPCEGGHARKHRVKSDVACIAYDCGFAVPGDYHWTTLEDVELQCSVRATGEVAGEPVLIKAEPNTNITCQKTVIPAVRYVIHEGSQTLVTIID